MTLWLNKFEAMELTKRSRRTLQSWDRAGKLDVRLVGTGPRQHWHKEYSLDSLVAQCEYAKEQRSRNLPRIRNKLDACQPETVTEAYLRLTAALGRPPTVDELSESIS